MSTSYTTEPPPTASAILHTTAGPIYLSLFAQQTPLTTRNFLQHALDGTYDNCTFHRIAPGFVVQTGDPSNTGQGGQSIYELERDFERYDAAWARETGREVGERIVFGDESHSRLKFNRRGLVGMAKMGGGNDDGNYGSQFFITLGDCRRELDGRCTMFGRVEREGIYNVVKIAEAELVEGTERPVYPEKILRVEVLERPKGEAWQGVKKRRREVELKGDQEDVRPRLAKTAKKKKGGKALLSFAEDDGDEALIAKPKRAKFNPTLIDAGSDVITTNGTAVAMKTRSPPPPRIQKPKSPPLKPVQSSGSPSTSRSPETNHRRKPSFHDSTTQLPLRDPEIPSRSRSRSVSPPARAASKLQTASSLEAEIAALKASMRRDTGPAPVAVKQKSALENMIPLTSTRGRKRRRPGESNAKDDAHALQMLNAFKARLDQVQVDAGTAAATTSKSSRGGTSSSKTNGHIDPDFYVSSSNLKSDDAEGANGGAAAAADEEASLCDLHFIANCQSCSRWDNPDPNSLEVDTVLGQAADDGEHDGGGGGAWMSHALSFAKDRLGKDLTWRRKAEEELVVIDPRVKEKEIKMDGKKRNGAR